MAKNTGFNIKSNTAIVTSTPVLPVVLLLTVLLVVVLA
jgi:hypothetical protein